MSYEKITFTNNHLLTAADLNQMQDNTNIALQAINNTIGNCNEQSSSSTTIVGRISALEDNLTETEPGSESLEGDIKPTFADRVNNLEIAVGISEGKTSLASRVQNLEKEFITTDKGPEEGTFADKLTTTMSATESNSERIAANQVTIGQNQENIKTNQKNIKTISQTLYGSNFPEGAGNSETSLCTRVTNLEKKFVIAPYNTDENKNVNAVILYDTTDLGTKTLKPGQIYLKVTNILAD